MEIIGKWLGLLGVAAVLLGVAWLYLKVGKRVSERDYDERQVQAENASMKLGFLIAVVYYFFLWIWIHMTEPSLDTVETLIFAGIVGAAVLVHLCLLLMGAVLPLGKLPALTFASSFLMAGAQLVWGLREAALLEKVEVFGYIPWNQLILSVGFFVMGITHLVSWLRSGKCDE